MLRGTYTVPRPAHPTGLKSVERPAVVLRRDLAPPLGLSRPRCRPPRRGARPFRRGRPRRRRERSGDAPQRLRLGNRGHLVRDPETLDARLRAADPAAPRPLLLVYGPGSDLVRGAATIVGLRPVTGSMWIFELGTREPELEGRVVVFGGQPVRRTQGLTYDGRLAPAAAPSSPGCLRLG